MYIMKNAVKNVVRGGEVKVDMANRLGVASYLKDVKDQAMLMVYDIDGDFITCHLMTYVQERTILAFEVRMSEWEYYCDRVGIEAGEFKDPHWEERFGTFLEVCYGLPEFVVHEDYYLI